MPIPSATSSLIHNSAANKVNSITGRNMGAVQHAMAQLSTGSRNVSVSDDPSGVAMYQKSKAIISIAQQGQRNAIQGSAMINVIATGIDGLLDIVSSGEQLIAGMQNSTLSKDALEDTEKLLNSMFGKPSGLRPASQQGTDDCAFQKLLSSIRFAGKSIFVKSGSTSGTNASQNKLFFQTSDDPDGITELEVEDVSLKGLKLDQIELKDVSNIDSEQSINKRKGTLKILSEARNKLAEFKSTLGASQAKLQRESEASVSAIEELKNAASTYNDCDFMNTLMDLVQAQHLAEASISMLPKTFESTRNLAQVIKAV